MLQLPSSSNYSDYGECLRSNIKITPACSGVQKGTNIKNYFLCRENYDSGGKSSSLSPCSSYNF